MYFNIPAVYRNQYQVLRASEDAQAISRLVHICGDCIRFAFCSDCFVGFAKIAENPANFGSHSKTVRMLFSEYRFRVAKSGKWNVHVCAVKSLVNVRLQFHYFAQKPSPANGNSGKYVRALTRRLILLHFFLYFVANYNLIEIQFMDASHTGINKSTPRMHVSSMFWCGRDIDCTTRNCRLHRRRST